MAAIGPSICRWWRKTAWDVSNLRRAVKTYSWVQAGKSPAQVSIVVTTQMSSGTRWSTHTEQDNPFHNVSKTQTSVFFLQGIKAVSEQSRASCEQNGKLRLCRVSERDTGVYFCDRQITERGVKWTFRRAVNVTAVRKCCVCVCVYCHKVQANRGPVFTTPFVWTLVDG